MRATDVGFDLQRSAQSRRAAMSKKGVARKGEGDESDYQRIAIVDGVRAVPRRRRPFRMMAWPFPM